MERGRQYQVPPDSEFVFDDQPGEERLFIVLSRQPSDISTILSKINPSRSVDLPARKKTEITVATREVIVVRQTRSVVRRWCVECGTEVNMLAADKAATLLGVSTRDIYRRVESRQAHFIETVDGRLWICARSLLD